MQFLRYIKIATITIWIALLGVSIAQTAFAGNTESGVSIAQTAFAGNTESGVSIAQTTFAGNTESGEFVSVSTYRANYTVVNHGGTRIMAGSLRGKLTIIESSGGPFVLGATYPTSCAAYIKEVGQVINDIEAPCTMTNFNGDTLYMMATKNVVESSGTFNLLGGTGVYDGLTGTCNLADYTAIEYLVNDRAAITLSCNWTKKH